MLRISNFQCTPRPQSYLPHTSTLLRFISTSLIPAIFILVPSTRPTAPLLSPPSELDSKGPTYDVASLDGRAIPPVLQSFGFRRHFVRQLSVHLTRQMSTLFPILSCCHAEFPEALQSAPTNPELNVEFPKDGTG